MQICEKQVKGILTKTAVPTGGYAVNPYIGCAHSCRYCYASFMKRFTGHTEQWGTFMDVKYWDKIKNPRKFDGERIVIGTVTDGYNPYEERFQRTRAFLEEMRGVNCALTIITKSDLVLRDLDLLREFKDVTVAFSINTLDEAFRADMDSAVSIERRFRAMEVLYKAGIRTACFISPIFPELTDVCGIIEHCRNFCDLVWLENLNLRGSYKRVILDYIEEKYPHLVGVYADIYRRGRKDYWRMLEEKLAAYTKENGLPYLDNYLPDMRADKGFPAVVNYLFHEEVRGSENTGRRKQ